MVPYRERDAMGVKRPLYCHSLSVRSANFTELNTIMPHAVARAWDCANRAFMNWFMHQAPTSNMR